MTDFQDLKDRPDAYYSLNLDHRIYIRRVYRTIALIFLVVFYEYMQTHTLDGKPRKFMLETMPTL